MEDTPKNLMVAKSLAQNVNAATEKQAQKLQSMPTNVGL
jgi:hypothetical protein